VKYLLKDHLGSTIAVLTDQGVVLQQFIYDPWGKQYNVFSNTNLMLAYSSDATTKGYTGHEMVNDFDVIHMGGRTYNPVIGRFMQADPIIQAPTDLQSYNRYAYVRNNPLTLIDPSGYSWWTKFRDSWLKPLASIAISFYMGPWAAGYFNSAIVGGAVTGFVAGAVVTGSLRGAMVGAFSGAMFGAISDWAGEMSYGNFKEMAVDGNWDLLGKLSNYGGNYLTSGQISAVVAAHAVSGGIISKLQGGKFGNGFFSAGVTKGAMGSFVTDEISFTNAIKSALVGGTASVISGGKFANGAVTSAFQYSLNWATKAHNYLIRKAYGNEMSDIELAAMEAGSRYTDRMENQDDENSYKHSMTSDKNPNVAAMESRRDKWVSQQVNEGVKNIDGTVRGNIAAYFKIGEGLHTVMDQYSPAHMGQNQHWDITQFYKHGPLPTSLEGTRSVIQPQYNYIIENMRGVWKP